MFCMQGTGKFDRQTVWIPYCGLEKRDFGKSEDEDGAAGHKTILVRNIKLIFYLLYIF